jgi:predicted GNAT family N-acyltransferase
MVSREDQEFEVRRVALEDILSVRWKVLRPGKPRESAVFPGDDAPNTEHWAAFDAEGRVVSVASIYEAPLPQEQRTIHPHAQTYRQLRGMATDSTLQGKGPGSALIRGVIRSLSDRKSPTLFWCNARERAVPFYERHGFRVTSDRFDIPGVGPHFVMQLAIESQVR